MFIQVIQGKCSRQDEMRALSEEWAEQSGPSAEGWLGGTYGFTDDDTFIGVIRFDGPRDRDGQLRSVRRRARSRSGWRALFDGPVEFHDCDDVTLLFNGGSDDAEFVQIIRGKVDDVARLRAVMTSDPEGLHAMRPDILGATLAIEPDGTYTETVAFTDEESARAGEGQPPPPEIASRARVRHAGRDVLRPAEPLVRERR